VRYDAGLVGMGRNQAAGEKEVVESWEKWEAILKINSRRCDGRLIPYLARLRFAAVMSQLWLVDLESPTLLWIVCDFATFGHRKVNDQ
jgi:hypothetical protein